MPAAFVKNLFANNSKGAAEKLVLSGSAVVSAGNTIFVAFGTGAAFDPSTVTDNLGNSYVQVAVGGTGNISTRLYRADITNPGTLTTITIDQPPGWNIYAGIAVEFSGVGALRFTGSANAGNFNVGNAYPGGVVSATSNYAAGDLWIGAWAQKSPNTFAVETGGIALPAQEPTAEQRTTGGTASTNVSLGLLYYTSASPQSGVGLVGRFSATGDMGAVGAAIAGKISGPTYNDVCSGSIVFTGTVVESWKQGLTNTDVPAAGSLALGGSVIESSGKGYTDARTGALAFSGTKTEGMARADAPSGRIAFSGTASDVWFIHVVHNDAPTGAIGIAGTRTETWRCNDKPTGRVTIVGTTGESAVFRQSVTGRVQMWGWAARSIPASTPQPVGIPGALAESANIVVNPTVLHPAIPSGYQVGDVLICFSASGSGASLNVGAVTPGWTVVTVDLAPRLHLIAKIAESLEELPPTLTYGTSPGGSGYPSMARIVAFRNLDTRDLTQIADVIGAQSTLSSVTQMAGGAALTTVYDNDLVLSLSKRDASGSISGRIIPPAGFGMVTWDLTGSGENLASAWAYQVKKPVGQIAAPVFGVSTTDQTPYGTVGVAVALKAAAVDEHVSTPSGTLSLTGSRVERKIYTDKPTGSIGIVGTAVESQRHRPLVAGRLALSGAVQESWRHVGACAGSITLLGTVDDAWLLIDRPTGAIAVTGSAVDDYTVNFTDACTGVLRLMGVAATELVLQDAPAGVFKLGGTRSEFITIEDAIFYDDFPAGLVELDGRLVFVDESIMPGRPGRIVYGIETGRIVRAVEPGRLVENLTGRVTR
jgi:hypothetical protein